MMNKNAVALLVVTLAFAVAPFVTPPFSGYDPDLFPVRIERPSIQPAGYAFAIWGLIYLWLIVHAAFGLWKRSNDLAWNAVRLPLLLALGVGTFWLWIAGHSVIWGTVTILIMAGGALMAFLRADTGVDRWLLSAPTAIFAGWLTAASAVSIGVLVSGYGWLTDTQAASVMLAAVLAVAVTVQLRRPQMPVYGLTVIWALGGVIRANLDLNQTVAALAGAGIAIMAATLWVSRKA